MKCDICNRTDLECKIRKIKDLYLCPKHVTQYYRYGKFLKNTIYDNNKYIIDEEQNLCKIELRNKKCEIVGYAIIDLEDVDKCKKYKWHMRKGTSTNYVIASLSENEKLHLHRYLTNCPEDMEVDHIDYDGLNNKKENLRIVTHSQNGANRKNNNVGVIKVPSNNYQASIMKDYEHNYIGTFSSKEEAIEARKEKFNELFL